jgi:o-succinylbenzoate---CoA ligase
MNPSDIFIQTSKFGISRATTLSFAQSLHTHLRQRDLNFTPEAPLALRADKSLQTALTITACWILEIPFIALPPSASENEYQNLLGTITPLALSATSAARPSPFLDSFPRLEIQDLFDRFVALLETSSSDNFSTVSNSTCPDLFHNHDSLFGYFFTSGTTGDPRIVPIYRSQIIAAASASLANIPLDSQDLWYQVLPLHHIGGVSVLTRALLGGFGVYLEETFDPAITSDLLSTNHQIKVASFVPTQLNRLLEIPTFLTHASFRTILLGGGPISPILIDLCSKRGIRVMPSFGMTETAAQCIAMPLGEKPRIDKVSGLVSCGKPLHGIEACLIEEEYGQKLLYVRGDQVFRGYLRDNSELDGNTFTRISHDSVDNIDLNNSDSSGKNDDSYKSVDLPKEGISTEINDSSKIIEQDKQANSDETSILSKYHWFCTGDYAQKDEDGYYYIEMRRSDRIVTGGENVNPHEVESILADLDFVKESAVLGLADETWGQVVCAVLVLEEGSDKQLDYSFMVKYALKSKVSSHKVPKKVILIDEIPKTASGKVRRNELIAILNT